MTFSHLGYREECRRIARLMGERYGKNPHVAAWQIDNEYGCHDTTLSYSDAAREGLSGLAGAAISINRCAEPRMGQCVLVDGL